MGSACGPQAVFAGPAKTPAADGQRPEWCVNEGGTSVFGGPPNTAGQRPAHLVEVIERTRSEPVTDQKLSPWPKVLSVDIGMIYAIRIRSNLKKVGFDHGNGRPGHESGQATFSGDGTTLVF